MRTTIDIDDPILKEVKTLQKKEGKSLGRLVSDLLVQALKGRKGVQKSLEVPRWISKGMGARVDLTDKEAVYAAMEEKDSFKKGVNPL